MKLIEMMAKNAATKARERSAVFNRHSKCNTFQSIIMDALEAAERRGYVLVEQKDTSYNDEYYCNLDVLEEEI